MEGNVLCKAGALDEVYLWLHPHRIDLQSIAEALLHADDAFYGNRWVQDLTPRKPSVQVLNRAYLLTGSSPFSIDLGFACLKAQLRDRDAVLEVPVLEALNPMTITYVDLVLLIAEQLLALAEGLGISFDLVPEDVMPHADTATAYFTGRLLGLERPLDGIKEVETGLLQSLRDTRLAAKYSKPLHQMLLHTLEPKVTQLIGFCNHMIATLQGTLAAAGKGRLWILLPDLHRLEPDRVRGLFYPHAPILSTFACCACFSMPGALYFHPHFRRIGSFFSRHWEVPAVRLGALGGGPDALGIGTLRSIVGGRMDLALFEGLEILDALILASGGCLIDLLRLVVIAADNACNQGRISMSLEDGDWAIGSLIKTYAMRLSTPITPLDEKDPQKVQLDRYRTLAAIAAETAGLDMLEGRIGLALRQQDCVLRDGRNGYQVHPMVTRVMAAQGMDVRGVAVQEP